MPLSPRMRKVFHYIFYVEAITPAIVGAAFLVISFTVVDGLDGQLGLAAIALLVLGVSLFRVWQHSRVDLTRPGYTADDLPLDHRRATVLSAARVLAVMFSVGSIFIAYQLTRVEFGWVNSRDVWPGEFVMLYHLLGFWPSILLIPILGLVVLVAFVRKLRKIRVETERAAGLVGPWCCANWDVIGAMDQQ